MDYLGSADYLTSPVSGKVEAWTHYNEWGLISHNAVLKCGQRELDLVKRYATHDYDSVLELYYAKARFYDAHDRHFTAVDPILDPSQYDLREYVQNPVQFVQYLYVTNNPIKREVETQKQCVRAAKSDYIEFRTSVLNDKEIEAVFFEVAKKVKKALKPKLIINLWTNSPF